MSNSKNLYFRMKRRLQNSIANGNTSIVCESCGIKWSPIIRIGGRLPNKWWICPICGNGEKL